MNITIKLDNEHEEKLTFLPIQINFTDDEIDNVFQSLQKPLGVFVAKPKYIHLQEEVYENYHKFLNAPLGQFLMENKQSVEIFYQRFLKHAKDINEENGEIEVNVLTGDSKYRRFSIPDKEETRKVGLYMYSIGDEIKGIKYIGSCYHNRKPNNFFKRVEGYGNIAPYNTLKDGQGTNVRINPKINKYRENIRYWIFPMENNKEKILKYEKILIENIFLRGNIIWNIKDVPKMRPRPE